MSFWDIATDRSERRGPHGPASAEDHALRPIVRPEQVVATAPWWVRLYCRVYCHQLACCPAHSVFVYWQGWHQGIRCERCGALIGR